MASVPPGQENVEDGGREGDERSGPGVVAVTPRADGHHACQGELDLYNICIDAQYFKWVHPTEHLLFRVVLC